MTNTPLMLWANALSQWAIPDDIIAQAPQSPWIHPVSSFRPTGNLHVDSPSRTRALEALPDRGSVLDVGCGGGRGAFALVPPAATVVGVDHQQEMLDVFADEAALRSVACTTVLGDWPDVADVTPSTDVAICHHVYYNVANIEPFARALDAHAKTRVVVELPVHHPLSSLQPMWKHFWDLDRPISPTAHDALAAMTHLGFAAHLETFVVESEPQIISDELIEHTRIRLCLPSSKDSEIRDFLHSHTPAPRELATIWWDTK
jgi:SAM-dependent methyltransferase